jgi:hypothetical protein
MKTIQNEKTNATDIQFSAKLVSIADKALTNVNGKEYFPCAIEFTDKAGKSQRTRAIMYASNKSKGVQVGNFYLATAANTDKGILIQVSHLEGSGGIATADMFGFASKEVTKTAEIPA